MDDLREFTLLRGPLFRLCRACGLARDRSSWVRAGFVLALVLWGGCVSLAALAGKNPFVLDFIDVHVRLLLAVVLMFLGEALLDGCARDLIRDIARSGLAQGESLVRLHSRLRRLARWQDSALAEGTCLLLALALTWHAPSIELPGFDHRVGVVDSPQTAVLQLWYLVAMTAFRFLVFRWLWRLLLWGACLAVLARLPLALLPTHADGMAGLSGLDTAQASLAPLVLALSAVMAAGLCSDIASGQMSLEQTYSVIAAVLVFDAVVFVGPLLLFCAPLWRCRVRGISSYAAFSARYSREFEQKWLAGKEPDEPMLGNADVQSLADLQSVVSIVRELRLLPLSAGTLGILTSAAITPMLPLLPFKYPMDEILQRIFSQLSGF